LEQKGAVPRLKNENHSIFRTGEKHTMKLLKRTAIEGLALAATACGGNKPTATPTED
jgi:hypothetical protein